MAYLALCSGLAIAAEHSDPPPQFFPCQGPELPPVHAAMESSRGLQLTEFRQRKHGMQ